MNCWHRLQGLTFPFTSSQLTLYFVAAHLSASWPIHTKVIHDLWLGSLCAAPHHLIDVAEDLQLMGKSLTISIDMDLLCQWYVRETP